MSAVQIQVDTEVARAFLDYIYSDELDLSKAGFANTCCHLLALAAQLPHVQ